MRSESPGSLEVIATAFEDAVKGAVAGENDRLREGPPLQLDLERIGERPSGETDPNTPLVQRAKAVTRYFGVEPVLSRSSTNSNIPISMGIPAVTIGRGGAGGDNHSPSEWWMNVEGHKAIQRAFLILVAEAGLGS